MCIRDRANAVDAPVRCMMTAGEGGAYGMALLTAYMLQKGAHKTLPDFLDNVFANAQSTALSPDPVGRAGFEAYLARYQKALAAERAAVENL